MTLPVQWLMERMRLILWSRQPSSECFGIRLIDANQDATDDSRFFALTREALDLIRRRDSRRFRRVCHFIRYIINEESLTEAHYCATVGAAVLDFNRMEQMIPKFEALRVFLASTLIHESTHGLIQARGVTRRHSIRVERLCWREESRFLGKFDLKLREQHEKLFSPEGWKTHWKRSFFQRLVLLRRRVIAARRGLKTAQQIGASRSGWKTKAR
jgi:hypothetical protein